MWGVRGGAAGCESGGFVQEEVGRKGVVGLARCLVDMPSEIIRTGGEDWSSRQAGADGHSNKDPAAESWTCQICHTKRWSSQGARVVGVDCAWRTTDERGCVRAGICNGGSHVCVEGENNGAAVVQGDLAGGSESGKEPGGEEPGRQKNNERQRTKVEGGAKGGVRGDQKRGRTGGGGAGGPEGQEETGGGEARQKEGGGACGRVCGRRKRKKETDEGAGDQGKAVALEQKERQGRGATGEGGGRDRTQGGTSGRAGARTRRARPNKEGDDGGGLGGGNVAARWGEKEGTRRGAVRMEAARGHQGGGRPNGAKATGKGERGWK
ncbi:hypothetical protein KI387_044207 [Taxus chinensis]|uniref:Uncharacterized protein n=1 Tax=Taxus chinensis TaxID=29808 RepID=A0AA38FT13_TAXCH|nr:hypothetical protein KI387_044207 [Taxus chinensis]